MYRAIAALVVLFVLGVTCWTTWTALQPPLESLIVPGAADVQVVATGWGQRQITYRAPGSPYAWYYALTQCLEKRGWTALDNWYPGKTDTIYNAVLPLHFQLVSAGFVQDQVALTPDDRSPNLARITVRRCIALPWRSLLLRLPG
jgi:hypothetical protein